MGALYVAVYYVKSTAGTEGFMTDINLAHLLPPRTRHETSRNTPQSFANMLNDETLHQTLGSVRNDSSALQHMRRFEAAYDPNRVTEETK